MSSWQRSAVLAALGMALAAGPCAWRAAAQAPAAGGDRAATPLEQPPRLPPDQEAAGILHQAYDGLSLVRVWMSSNRAKLPEDDARLADQAEEFYRTAHRAYKARDYNRATMMGLAALTASQGLTSVLHATTPPPPGLPPPPEPPAPAAPSPGQDNFPPPPRPNPNREGDTQAGTPGAARTPQEMARDLLRAAYRGINDAAKAGPDNGAARAFLDASRGAYQQARKDYDAGDYGKALDRAAAAEAWSHIGDYLKRADNPNQPAPARREGAAPPEQPPGRP